MQSVRASELKNYFDFGNCCLGVVIAPLMITDPYGCCCCIDRTCSEGGAVAVELSVDVAATSVETGFFCSAPCCC
jgi:hypothetical protein